MRGSRYSSGLLDDQVRVACAQRETPTIASFALEDTKWDGLYLDRYKGADLDYAAKVEHGFDRESAKALRDRLTANSKDTALQQANRASRHMGRAEAACRGRVSSEVG